MLSIQIPTIISRSHLFKPLLNELRRQAEPYGDKIEIIHLLDEKDMPLGQKRRLLYEMSSMPYSVQWDDDDWIHPLGISHIMKELEYKPDSVAYRMVQEFDGKPSESIPGKMLICDFRKRYAQRMENMYGFDVVEPTNCKCVVKTDIALKAWKDIPDDTRFGEDGMFGRIIYKNKLIRVERYIDKHIYWYLNLSGLPFGEYRYGLAENYPF